MIRIGRNDLCWCKSGKKYKSCHLGFDQKLEQYHRSGVIVPEHKIIKNIEQIEGIRRAGRMNTEILNMVDGLIKEGITTEDINQAVHEYTLKLGGIPAPLNYKGFPKSVCTSLNDVVCHGIPSPERRLVSGDILNVDVTTIVDGYYGDASRMYGIGTISAEAEALIAEAKESLRLGFEAVKPWGFLGDVGAAVSEYLYEKGYTVVREIGGHGVGLDFHEEPWVSHIGERGTDMLLVPGMVFTIEPMVNMGEEEVFQDEEDGWTIYTEDESLSAQWEYTVLVTEDGAEILAY